MTGAEGAMPQEEMLVMAMTRMRSGVCTAGLLRQRDERSGLRWVRPVKEHGVLLLGDVTTVEGQVFSCGDVVRLNLLRPCPEPPHCEDWITDWVYQRPQIVDHLDGERWGRSLRIACDRAPDDVLGQRVRSLCLVRPEAVWAVFSGETPGRYEARVGFQVAGVSHPSASTPQGVPVSDIKWRALGRDWLAGRPATLRLSGENIKERLNVADIYLAVGLTRLFEGRIWPLVIGVHTVPDYAMMINYDHL
jgi:hypothetical protein